MTWIMLCKRTEDPKLTWLESKFAEAKIPTRRHGHSFHAPILEVQADFLDAAWRILALVDDIPDDEEFWANDPDGCSCSEDRCAFCSVNNVIEEINR